MDETVSSSSGDVIREDLTDTLSLKRRVTPQDQAKNLLSLLRQSSDEKSSNKPRSSANDSHTCDNPRPLPQLPNVPSRVLLTYALGGADIRYMQDVFDPEFISWAWDSLELHRQATVWKRLGYGREVVQWSHPPGRTYQFSETVFVASKFPAFALAVKKTVESVLSQAFPSPRGFNYCVCNYYDSGNSGVSWHADAEDELIDGSPIACVSFGAPRVFGLRPIAGTDHGLELRLASGSVVVMAGATQRNYFHSILKEPGMGARYSLTFRIHR